MIRPISPNDEAQWRVLWAGYCTFYKEDVAEEVTSGLLNRLFAPEGVVRGIVATDDEGYLLGFAHYVLHPHTWSERTLCYLEDLYVSPDARGKGVGKALIDHLIALGRENHWKRVYWHTEIDNETARRLYDRFGPADPYVRYTVSL
ncbi:MAG: GNAT family N-acetyltransferase [Capsulimonadales bacterium]|nr:GNAT family N-acetyltransferase [Capsulimonadales bacterium]